MLGDWETNGSGMTVMAWVNADGPGDASWNRFVDVQDGSNNQAHSLYWDADDDKYGFHTPAGNATVNTDIATDRWVHLTGTVDPAENQITLYEDGAQVSNTSGTSTWDDLKVSVGGRYDAQTTDPANATIDQVRVYDRALNDSEIASFTNTDCNNRQRTIECINSPELCNVSEYVSPFAKKRYVCQYGQYDTPDENNSLRNANTSQVGTGVCCQPDQNAYWDGSKWACASSNECKPASCGYNISNNEDGWFNSTSDGSSNACNSQVPNLYVNTDEQPKPERRSQACCYVPKDGQMGYWYKDGNVKIYG